MGRILNPQTGHVSPQCHIVVDGHFSTVMSSSFNHELFDDLTWNKLTQTGLEKAPDPEDMDGETVPFAGWFDEWVRSSDVTSEDSLTSASEKEDVDEVPASAPATTNETPVSEGAPLEPPSGPVTTRSGRHCQQVHHDSCVAGGNPRQKIRQRQLQHAFEQGLDWTKTLSQLCSSDTRSLFAHLSNFCDEDAGTQEDWSPLAFKAKCCDEDNPSGEQAVNDPNAEGCKEACKKEHDTPKGMGFWEIVKREPWMNVLPCVWALKHKLHPDGTIKKLKSGFCAGGHCQLKDRDHHQSVFSPVVSWSTVRLLLILSIISNLSTQQTDFTSAFVNANIDKPPNFDQMTPQEQRRQGVCIEMPRGFLNPGKVLKLRKSLCGLKQAPRIWFNHLKNKLELLGFVQCVDVDQCLFVSEKVVLLCCVDDGLLCAEDPAHIQEVIEQLCDKTCSSKKKALWRASQVRTSSPMKWMAPSL